jgi:hypothetical protein
MGARKGCISSSDVVARYGKWRPPDEAKAM